MEHIIDEMRLARRMAIGEGGGWQLLPEQRDELFAALPHSWSIRTKKLAAYGLISSCVILNVIALAYAFAGV